MKGWAGGPRSGRTTSSAPGAAEMVPWARGLGPDYQEMIDHWDRLGLVVDRGPAGDPSFVEDERDADALGP